jgi:hypothetical protein
VTAGFRDTINGALHNILFMPVVGSFPLIYAIDLGCLLYFVGCALKVYSVGESGSMGGLFISLHSFRTLILAPCDVEGLDSDDATPTNR